MLPENIFSNIYLDINEPQSFETAAQSGEIIINSSCDSHDGVMVEIANCEECEQSEAAQSTTLSRNDNAANYLSHLLVRNSERCTVILRNGDANLLVPLVKTSNRQKTCVFRGSRIWNDLNHRAKQALC